MFKWWKLRKIRKFEDKILEANCWYTNRSSDFVNEIVGDE